MKKAPDPFLTGLPPTTPAAIKESAPPPRPRTAKILLEDVARAVIAKDPDLVRSLTEKRSLSSGQIKIDDAEPMSLTRILVRHFDPECATALLHAGLRINTTDRFGVFADAAASRTPYESLSWIVEFLFKEKASSSVDRIDRRGVVWPLQYAIEGFVASENNTRETSELVRFLVDLPSKMPKHIADLDAGRIASANEKNAFFSVWSQVIPLALRQNNNDLLLKAMNNPASFGAFSGELLTTPAKQTHMSIDSLFRFIEVLPCTTPAIQKTWLQKLPGPLLAISTVRRHLSPAELHEIDRALPELNIASASNFISMSGRLSKKCQVNTLTEALIAGGSPLVPALAANPITAPVIASILTESFDCMVGFLISSPHDRIVATLSPLRQSIVAWRSPSNTNMLQYAHVLSGSRSPLVADLAASIDPVLLTEPNKNGIALRDLLPQKIQVKADKRALRGIVKSAPPPPPPSTPKSKKQKRLM